MRLRTLTATMLCLVPLSLAHADEKVTVSGCVIKGVEAGCIVLRTFPGKIYNISAAQPKPKIGAYGEIEGTIKTGVVSTCMQGDVINPASWTQKGKFCPRHKR